MKTSPSKVVSRINAALVRKLARRAWRLAPEAALRSSAALLALFAFFGFNPQTLAATQTWVSGDALNVSTSWNGGAGPLPGTGDIALFNSGSATTAWGGNISFGELEFTTLGGALTLGGDTGPFTMTLDGVTATGTDAAGVSVSGTTIGIDMSTAAASVTLGSAGDSVAVGAVNQSWFINTGTTLTIAGPLTGSAAISVGSGSTGNAGSLTLSTTADTFTGSIAVNNGGTLNLNIAQSTTASYILNNGTTLTGNTSMNVGNLIYANSGTFTLGVFNGSSATDDALFYGNGNISFTGNGLSNVSWSSAGNATNMFGNFGGTVTFSSNQNIRLQDTTASGGNVYSTMANFNLGANGGGLSNDEGSSLIDLGGLQGSSATDSMGLGNSGHGVKVVVGGANIASETYAGNIASSSAGTEFSKIGTGTLIMTGLDTAAATYDCTNGSYPLDGFSNEAFGGTLEFSYTAHTSLLASGGILGIAGGGTLEFLGNSGAVDADTQLDTIVGGLNGGNATYAGGGALIVNPNASTSTTFNMGALTASAAGATLDVIEVTGNGTASVTTSSADTNGILAAGNVVLTSTASSGGAATTTFAVGNTATTNISAYTGATTYTTGVGSATANYILNDQNTANQSTNGGFSIASGAAFYTLQLTDDVSGSGGNLTFGGAFTTGPILFTGAYAETLSGGTSASNLIFQDYGAGTLTYENAITGTATITVAGNGSGTIVISGGGDSSTGATFVNLGGTLSVGAAADLGTGTINLGGGILQATGGFSLTNTVTLGGDGGTIDVTNGNALTLTGLIGGQRTSGLINIYATPLTKTDSGTLILNQTSSTYLGATIIDGGILSVSTLANGNSVSSIGEAPATANALVLNGGTLQYGSTATTAAVTNRTFTVGPNGGTLDASGPTGDTLDFNSPSPVWYNTALNGGTNYSPSLTLTGGNLGTNILAAAITDPVYVNSAYTGTTSLTKTGAGQWQLDGINTFSGGLTVTSGTLQAGAGDINAFGSGAVAVNGGALDLNANAITVGAFSGNSSGAVVTSSASTGTPGLMVQQGGATNTFAGSIQNGSAPSGLSFATLGSGKTILTGANTYTGATNVGAGTTLALGSGGSLGNTAVAVNGTLLADAGNGGIGGTVTLNASSVLSQQDGAIGSLSLGGLTFNGSSSISFDLQDNGTLTGDTITVTAAATGSGSVMLNVDALASTAQPASGSTFTLITDTAGAGLNLPSFTYTPDVQIDGQTYDLSLAANAGSDVLTLTKAIVSYYWTGANSASWSNTLLNFTKDHQGTTAQTASLNSTSNVFLTADTAANYSQTLDASYAINSLTFTGTSAVSSGNTTGAATNPVTVAAGTGGGANVLTIGAAAPFTDADGVNYTGVGIEVQNGNAGATISANVALGGAQAWEVDSANGLTVSGTISGMAADSLTKTGTGTLTLSAPNTYAGNTIVTAGKLALSSGGAIGSTGVLTVSGGTFDLASNAQTVGGLVDGSSSLGTVTSSVGATATLTINDTVISAGTFSGAITDNGATGAGGLALAFNGPGTETLSGSNSYSGGTTVYGGSLIAANNYALGNPSSTNANDGLTISPTAGTSTVYFTSATPKIAALVSGGGGTSDVVLGNTASGGSATNLTIGGGGATTVFSGNISDLKGTNANAIGSLTIIGGSLTLAGVDTYFGGTLLSGGALTINNTDALENSTLTVNNGVGTFAFGTVTSAVLGGLAGSANIALTNGSSANVALSIGNNALTGNTYSGALSGGGSLTVLGGGYTLSAPETYLGTTTFNGGTTNITGGIGSSGTPSGSVTLNIGGTVNLQGSASIYTSSLTINGGGNFFDSSTGVITDSGALDVNTNNSTNNGLLSITAGTVSASSALLGRDATNFSTTLPTAGNTGDGIYVNGGALNIAGTLGVGYINGSENSSVSMRMDSGSITVGGITTITNDAASRYSVLDINGGTFNENDPTGVGFLIGGGANTGLDAELLIRGTAIVNTSGITVGNSSETGGIVVLTDIGGTTNIGAGGISSSVPAATATVTVDLGSTTVATAPTLTSTSTWSSSVAMTLANSSGGVAPTFRTSTGDNITLSGTLSGGGGLTAAGTGVLTLSGNNGYTGVTAVNGGAVVLSGSVVGTTSSTVATGANLEVDGLLTSTAATAVSGELSGVGTITNGATLTSGEIAAGDTLGSTVAGTLTSNGAITDNGGSTFSFRLALNSATDSDELSMGNSSTLTLDNSLLQILVGGYGTNPAALDQLYVLINGGAGATGSGTDVFANAPFNGSAYVYNDNGYVFNVFYATDALNDGNGGNDIDVELVAVPEPGTWASLIGGIGMLVVWQRSRRRRA